MIFRTIVSFDERGADSDFNFSGLSFLAIEYPPTGFGYPVFDL
jgi:hypothetical protein